MIGLILVAVSWLLLHTEGKSLSVLGFNKPRQRGVECAVGLLIASLFASTQFLLISYFAGFEWILNPDLKLSLAIESFRWNFNSVVYEELLFRGYLLYKAIEFLGVRKACLISATVFGIYHWFSFGVIGSLVPMVFVFLMTGFFGLMLAYAFAKSKSIVLPIALHFGWNIVTIFVFSNGPLGAQLLIASQSEDIVLQGMQPLFVNMVLPLALPTLVLWILLTRVKAYNQTPESRSEAAA